MLSFTFELEAIEPIVDESAKHDRAFDASELMAGEVDDGKSRAWELVEQPTG